LQPDIERRLSALASQDGDRSPKLKFASAALHRSRALNSRLGAAIQ